MKKYLAYDAINSDYEEFETIEAAREYLKEAFLDEAEGYHPDMEGCKIFVLCETVKKNVIAKKSDFTPEEWEEKVTDTDFDEIWEHEFIEFKD